MCLLGLPFSNCPCSFWDQFNWIKVLLFSESFWIAGKFLSSRSEAEQLAGSDKKVFLLINFVPKILSFYIRIKFRLKNRVITVHLLQCKTNFFIYLCFWGRNLGQIKEHPPLQASINIIKKVFLIPLHSSTLVYIHLDSSSDSLTLVDVPLHSSTLILCIFRTDQFF